MSHPVFRPVRELLQMLFPAFCCHCDEILVGDERDLCTRCLSQLSWTHNASYSGNDTEMRLAGRIPFVAAASLLYFKRGSVAQTLLHQIKYYGNSTLAVQYGRLLGDELLQSGRFNGIDCIVPVPLHWWRQMRRGYNQSRLLAQGISSAMGLPVVSAGLYRRRYTSTQTHKNRLDRLENMRDVFAVRHPDLLAGKHILLVDDIITTGATTDSCCQALRSVPDLRISVASLALASL